MLFTHFFPLLLAIYIVKCGTRDARVHFKVSSSMHYFICAHNLRIRQVFTVTLHTLLELAEYQDNLAQVTVTEESLAIPLVFGFDASWFPAVKARSTLQFLFARHDIFSFLIFLLFLLVWWFTSIVMSLGVVNQTYTSTLTQLNLYGCFLNHGYFNLSLVYFFVIDMSLPRRIIYKPGVYKVFWWGRINIGLLKTFEPERIKSFEPRSGYERASLFLRHGYRCWALL